MVAAEFFERTAVDIRLGGRYSLANRRDTEGNRREFACRTSRVSPFHMMVAAPVIGAAGERVISYFGEFGKLDGWIADIVEGGFLFELSITKPQRETLASKLVWLAKQQKNPDLSDARNQERVVPENPHSTLVFADGTTLGCFVIDVSASGAAVSAECQPAIGTALAIGRCVGRVVRQFREGFAIRFVELQDRDRIQQLVLRT